MTNLVALNRKWKHLRNPTDGLIEAESGGLVVVRTDDFVFHQDIVNTKTGERYKVKYYNAGRLPPLKRIFDVSKQLNGYNLYSISIGRDGEYYLRRGTYRVGERVDGRLETKNFSKVESAIAYIKRLHNKGIEPELI